MRIEELRQPTFIGEGKIRSGAVTNMAHPILYSEITQRTDYKEQTTLEGQDKIIQELGWKARQERVRVYTRQRLQELLPR